MIAKLLYLNWKLFLSRMTRLQAFLFLGYSIFLVLMLFNLMGSAMVVVFLGSTPQYAIDIDMAWLTPEVHQLIMVVFANLFWILHFAFTSTRLLNVDENRKLLAFGYPAGKLAWHLNLIALYHPVNLIYNVTWLVFLSIQIESFWNVPVVLCGILLNYGIIFSIKTRFLQLLEKRFRTIVFSIIFVVVGTFQVVAMISSEARVMIESLAIQLTEVIGFFSWLPGGLIYTSATYTHNPALTATVLSFLAVLILLVFRDNYNKTLESLQNPKSELLKQQTGVLWRFLKQWLGSNAGKYYYYVIKHPYNRLQFLAIAIIPLVYIPILLYIDFGIISSVLILTMLAAIPVAVLAMGMANMFGYENRELLLHKQLPVSFEKQLKERFLGVIIVPLILFYIITIFEIYYLPQFGNVFDIYISNTFFFICFMLIFTWSSFYQYQKASFDSFSYKHPVIPQKVTFTLSIAIFLLGYTLFAPLYEYHTYRLQIMGFLILAIGFYLFINFNVLYRTFQKRILPGLWNEF
ncbi:MAG TPA: hypothetical protein VKM36_02930 [Balneolaceae bacterium]|nr:hypothetical protein [Balneolaceae bacterium]